MTADADRLWAALADPTRQRLVDLILAAGGATATALARDVPITVRRDRLDQATRHMAQVLDKWDRRVATIKHLAEAEHDPQR